MVGRSTLGRWSSRALPVAVAACGFLFARPAQAGVFRTAVKSGNWDSASTWSGGKIPNPDDGANIPAGITVTVRAGTSVTVVINGDGGKVNVAGALVVAGKLFFGGDLIVEAGGTVTNETTGSLTLSHLYKNSGKVVNKGVLLNQAPWFYDYGSLTNEKGATIDNRGQFTPNSAQTFTNRGTIENNYAVDIYSPFENYGTINNNSGRQFSFYRNTHNFPGSTFKNLGGVLVHGAVTLTNDGAITNSGSSFTIDGKLVNSCTGTLTGTAPTGKAPTTSCAGGVAAAPTTPPAPPAPPTSTGGAWQDISAGTRWSSISVGSASKMTGTSSKWDDGNSYLLNWSGSAFAYFNLPNTTTKVAFVQASIGADGTWWGVKADDSVWRYDGAKWAQVSGALRQVSVGNASNIWGVNAGKSIYKWNGSAWTAVSGSLNQVSAASDGTVWGITPTSKVVKWNGSGWIEMPGEAVQVSVGSASNVWCVNASGAVYKWNGSNWDAGTDAGSAQAVAAAADGTVLVLRTANGGVFRKP